MAFKTDINGYVLIETSNANSFGASPLNADNLTEFTNAINASYRMVTLGEAGSIYIVSQQLNLKADKTYIINGDIKIKDGITVSLTHDLLTGNNTVQLTNAATYYKESDRICFSDDDQPIQGGSTGQTRKVGYSFVVLDITGDVITLDRVSPYDFLVSRNAKIGHVQAVLIADNKDNIKITGVGSVDENKANQYDIEPVIPTVTEDYIGGCAISFIGCDNIKVDGITVKNAIMHNFVFYQSTNFEVDGVTGLAAHDKSIMLRQSEDGILKNSTFDGSDFEDGITMYDLNKRITIDNCVTTDCGRAGIIDNDTNEDIIIRNCNLQSWGYAYSLMHKTTTFEGTNHFSCVGHFRHGAARRQTFRLYLVKDHIQDMAGCILTGCDDGFGLLHINNCENVEVKNATCHGTITSNRDGWAAFATSLVPTTAKFTNLTLYNNKVDYYHDANTTLIIT